MTSVRSTGSLFTTKRAGSAVDSSDGFAAGAGEEVEAAIGIDEEVWAWRGTVSVAASDGETAGRSGETGEDALTGGEGNAF